MRLKAIGWLVTLGAVTYVVSLINWSDVAEAMRRVSSLDLVALTAIYFFGFFIRAVRSQVMLPQPGLAKSGAAVVMGYAANNVLPARLGEFVRAAVIGKIGGVKRTVALATIAVERMLDGLSLVILLFIGASELDLPEWIDKLRIVGVLIFGGAMIATLAVGFFASSIKPFIPKNRIGTVISGLLEGLVLATRSVPVTVLLVALSLVLWSCEALMFLYAFTVFGFSLDFSAALVVLGVVNLGLLIPSSPGGIGVFQFFAIQVLSLFAISKSEATAYGVVVHLCQLLPITILGLFLLNRLGLRSFQELAQKSD